jgi:hypothetical protein
MHKWMSDAECLNMDTNIFFEKYEEDKHLAKSIDHMCLRCSVAKECFALGVSKKEYGVWGGIYLTEGEPDDEFNEHKSQDDWSDVWMKLTMETE